MNRIKIIIAAITILAILSGTLFWIQNTQEVPPIKKIENQFTKEIEKDISLLKSKPNNKFCKDYYLVIVNHINEWYKPAPPKYPYGRFGKNQLENSQWKDDLERNLYAAYSDKFIEQAKFVLNGTLWNPADLNFIQTEKNRLKDSKLLVSGSPIDNEFTKIQAALNKYKEIESFIATCKNYSFPNIGLEVQYPISDVQEKINRSTDLLNNRLENSYVNNCKRLQTGLKEIPNHLFNAHVNYLNRKINQYSNTWCSYNSQREYTRLLYTTLKNQIDELNMTSIYGTIDTQTECSNLYSNWEDDNSRAYYAKYPCQN